MPAPDRAGNPYCADCGGAIAGMTKSGTEPIPVNAGAQGAVHCRKNVSNCRKYLCLIAIDILLEGATKASKKWDTPLTMIGYYQRKGWLPRNSEYGKRRKYDKWTLEAIFCRLRQFTAVPAGMVNKVEKEFMSNVKVKI